MITVEERDELLKRIREYAESERSAGTAQFSDARLLGQVQEKYMAMMQYLFGLTDVQAALDAINSFKERQARAGSATSEAKKLSSAENGKKGGRPKREQRQATIQFVPLEEKGEDDFVPGSLARVVSAPQDYTESERLLDLIYHRCSLCNKFIRGKSVDPKTCDDCNPML